MKFSPNGCKAVFILDLYLISVSFYILLALRWMEVIRSATCSASRSLPSTRKDLYWWIFLPQLSPPPPPPPPPPSAAHRDTRLGEDLDLRLHKHQKRLFIINTGSHCTQQALGSTLINTSERLICTHITQRSTSPPVLYPPSYYTLPAPLVSD